MAPQPTALDDAMLERGLAALCPLPEQAAQFFAKRADEIAKVRRIDAPKRQRQRPPADL